MHWTRGRRTREAWPWVDPCLVSEDLSLFRLDGKTALVTGASRGIGKATAQLLATQGSRLVLAARSVDALEAVRDELAAQGHAATVLELDLGDPGSFKERLATLPEEFGEIDILVNNAGITQDNLLARMSLEQWSAVIQVNLTGAYALTKELIRGMMKRRYGRIILVSSVVGLMGNPGQTNYAASKAGLIGFGKSLAKELGSRGITVNTVAPGYIETDMTKELQPAAREKLVGAIALARLGDTSDIAAGIAYLASEEAGYVTGEVLNISGGLYM